LIGARTGTKTIAAVYSWMSALGQKQTCAAHKSMSALCQERTFATWLAQKERPPRGGFSKIRSVFDQTPFAGDAHTTAVAFLQCKFDYANEPVSQERYPSSSEP